MNESLAAAAAAAAAAAGAAGYQVKCRLYNIGAMRLAKGANGENEQISARSGLGRGWLVWLLDDSPHSFGDLESKMVKKLF